MGSYKRDGYWVAVTGGRTTDMFRGVYDYLAGGERKREEAVPPYTIVRMFGSPPVSKGTKHVYTIQRADDYIHFKAAIMIDLLSDPRLAGQIERILRDFLRYTTVRERYVVVRVGSWWGEFTVAGNPPGSGTLMIESGAKTLQTDTA